MFEVTAPHFSSSHLIQRAPFVAWIRLEHLSNLDVSLFIPRAPFVVSARPESDQHLSTLEVFSHQQSRIMNGWIVQQWQQLNLDIIVLVVVSFISYCCSIANELVGSGHNQSGWPSVKCYHRLPSSQFLGNHQSSWTFHTTSQFYYRTKSMAWMLLHVLEDKRFQNCTDTIECMYYATCKTRRLRFWKMLSSMCRLYIIIIIIITIMLYQDSIQKEKGKCILTVPNLSVATRG